jgi:hypothetical protein
MPATDSILSTVRRCSAKELQRLLDRRQAEDKALRVLWRAAVVREREERRIARREDADGQ